MEGRTFDEYLTELEGNRLLKDGGCKGLISLMEAGEDPNVKSNGCPPLVRIVQIYLRTYAEEDMERKGRRGTGADLLGIGKVDYENKRRKCTEVLEIISRYEHTNLNITDRDGNTALQVAVANSIEHISRILRNAGAAVDIKNSKGLNIIQEILAMPLTTEKRDFWIALVTEKPTQQKMTTPNEYIRRQHGLGPLLARQVSFARKKLSQKAKDQMSRRSRSLDELLANNPLPSIHEESASKEDKKASPA